MEALNRTNAEIGGVIEAPQIREIPLDGRNWATLMTLAPGAVNTGDGAQRSIRFNGHSLDDSNFSFDGIDTSGIQEQTQKADTRLNVSLDSIAEFRVAQPFIAPRPAPPEGRRSTSYPKPAPTAITARCSNFCATTCLTPVLRSIQQTSRRSA